MQHENESKHTFFKDRLKSAMDEAGETKLSLSKKLGCAHTTIAAWLKGSEPGADKIAPAANTLNVTTQWLLTGIEPKHTSADECPGEESRMIVRESPDQIARTLAARPEDTAAMMSEEQLRDSLMEWAEMISGKPRYMQKAILGNLAIFVHELSHRLNDLAPGATEAERSKAVRYSAPKRHRITTKEP